MTKKKEYLYLIVMPHIQTTEELNRKWEEDGLFYESICTSKKEMEREVKHEYKDNPVYRVEVEGNVIIGELERVK